MNLMNLSKAYSELKVCDLSQGVAGPRDHVAGSIRRRCYQGRAPGR